MNAFLERAEALKPKLDHTIKQISNRIMLSQGEECVFDFGSHYVGYLKVDFDFDDAYPDSPVLVKLFFAEHKRELEEKTEEYCGWISKAWIQEEIIRVDEFPNHISFPRRYAFRYVRITILAAPANGKTVITNLMLDAVTSAPEAIALCGDTEAEKRIDEISLKTLSECMQEVFEDGVKRDRRLWLGDLRLQALANYQTFRHNDLVKRCLYLFAGTCSEDGRLCQSVYSGKSICGDGQTNFDYPLLFVSALKEYWKATNDNETAADLLPIAERQVCLSRNFFENDLIIDRPIGWCFLDWSFTLNRQAGAQAVYLCAERDLIFLLKKMNRQSEDYEKDYRRKCMSARNFFYDEKSGHVLSGAEKQISYASAIWFTLAGILTKEEGQRALLSLPSAKSAVKPVTPYLMHYYVQALIDCGCMDEARKVLNHYWGGMVDRGADTFWELFNPENPDESPYGGTAVLSYCHAWSCTPCYFYRKYFCDR